MYVPYTDNIRDLINFCKERERKYYSSLASVQALQKSKTKITDDFQRWAPFKM